MKTKECNIVQDLLPNYIEGLVSRETSEFVKKHIDECEFCKNKYILVKEDDDYKRENIQIEDEIEHNHLKKVKSKITQTRVTVLVVVVLSLIINTTLGIKYFGERKILSEINNRYENLKTLDNYTITRKTLEINYETKEIVSNDITTYAYKDGKYRRKTEESDDMKAYMKNEMDYKKMKKELNNIEEYADINVGERIVIYKSRGEYSKDKMSFYKQKGELFNYEPDINDFKIWYIPCFTKIKKENYENKEYYVLYYGNSKTQSRQLWINKESMIIERSVEKGEKYYREKIYNITINNVTDNELTVPNLQFYNEVHGW